MKYGDILKGIVIGIFIAATALSVGQCTRSAAAAEISDWKKCDTKIRMINTADKTLIYRVQWVDHDIFEFKGQPVVRCGGELAAHKSGTFSKNFRLCAGRHIVTWYGLRTLEIFSRYMFTLVPGVKNILITPTTALTLPAIQVNGKLKPEFVGPKVKLVPAAASINPCTTVMDIQKALVNEEGIRQALKDNYEVFVRVAKVTRYGKSVLLHTSIKTNNILYTMSIRGNSVGITSVDFTKQVTVAKGIIDIYYEGIKNNEYYCYAKQLNKNDNCKQFKIPKSSVFEQVIVMLFKKGETA